MVWGTFTESIVLDVDADFQLFETAAGSEIAIQLNPREVVSFVATAHATTGTENVEIQVLQGHRISSGNGLDGATSTSDIELDTAADGFSTDGDLDGAFIVMTSGGEAGEGRLITASVAADDGVNLDNALSGTPSAAETYDLYALGPTQQLLIPMGTIADDIPHHANFSVSAASGEWVLIRARVVGTNAHRVTLRYRVDGVSA